MPFSLADPDFFVLVPIDGTYQRGVTTTPTKV